MSRFKSGWVGGRRKGGGNWTLCSFRQENTNHNQPFFVYIAKVGHSLTSSCNFLWILAQCFWYCKFIPWNNIQHSNTVSKMSFGNCSLFLLSLHIRRVKDTLTIFLMRFYTLNFYSVIIPQLCLRSRWSLIVNSSNPIWIFILLDISNFQINFS